MCNYNIFIALGRDLGYLERSSKAGHRAGIRNHLLGSMNTMTAPFPRTAVLTNSNEIPSEKQAGNAILEAVEPCSSNENEPEQRGRQTESADKETLPFGMFGDMRVFRDFFLAAFSDGYHNVRIPSRRCLLIWSDL